MIAAFHLQGEAVVYNATGYAIVTFRSQSFSDVITVYISASSNQNVSGRVRYMWGLSIIVLSALLLLTSCQNESKQVSESLGHANEQLQNNNYQGAHDAVLHGMNQHASSAELFTGAVDITRKLIETDDTQARRLARDILGRLEVMVPRLSLDRMSAHRKELSDLQKKLARSTPNSRISETDSPSPIQLRGIESSKELPPELRLRLLEQEQNQRRDSILSSWRRRQISGDEATKTWNQYRDRLDKMKSQTHKEQFQRKMEQFRADRTKMKKFIKTSLSDGITFDSLSKWPERNSKMQSFVQKLNHWTRKLRPLVMKWNGDMTELDPVKKAVRRVTWAYSQAALKWIKKVENRNLTKGWWGSTVKKAELDRLTKRLPQTMGIEGAQEYIDNNRGEEGEPDQVEAMMKLLLLHLINEDLLIRYASRRYQDVWQRNVENLDQNGRVTASKLRVLGGLK